MGDEGGQRSMTGENTSQMSGSKSVTQLETTGTHDLKGEDDDIL